MPAHRKLRRIESIVHLAFTMKGRALDGVVQANRSKDATAAYNKYISADTMMKGHRDKGHTLI